MATTSSADESPSTTWDKTTTARLSLRRPALKDLALLHERLFADPRTWRLDSALRGGAEADTARGLHVLMERWEHDGLSSWVLRDRDSDELVGLGGCSILRSGVAWNLAFRVWPERWGKGLGREVAVAAISAAQQVRPDLPVSAVVLDSNVPSLRVIEQAGLAESGRADDTDADGRPSQVVLFTDRSVSADVTRQLLH